ncbi:MAG: LPS assembly lipoprotein LptE [Gammaproteobacteria bacterium]
MKLRSLLVVLSICVSACGFHLRGSEIGELDVSSIHVQSHGAAKLASIVKTQLQIVGIETVDKATEAEYVLQLKNESFTRNVLSVSPRTGKVEEFELVYTAQMAVSQADGTPVMPGDSIRVVRDYTFDEDAVLGKFTEERILQEDLTRRAASQVLRRLQAVLKRHST